MYTIRSQECVVLKQLTLFDVLCYGCVLQRILYDWQDSIHLSYQLTNYGRHRPIMTLWRSSKRVFYVINVVWSCAVICPLIIVYWSGTWGLLDLCFASFDATSDVIYCSTFGSLVTISGYIVLPLLAHVAGSLNSMRHLVVSRLFLYIYAFGMIAYWRGVWNCAELLAGMHLIFQSLSLQL
jgi:Fuseless